MADELDDEAGAEAAATIALLRQAVRQRFGSARTPPPDPQESRGTGAEAIPSSAQRADTPSPTMGAQARPPVRTALTRSASSPRPDQTEPDRAGQAKRGKVASVQGPLFDGPTAVDRAGELPAASANGDDRGPQISPGSSAQPAPVSTPPEVATAGERENSVGPPKAPKAGGAGERTTANISAGHRGRLRARFDRGETLADYELLELLLFRSLPRRDTKPIAKALIAAFGSFAGAMSAPAARLRTVEGVGDQVVSDFRLVRAAAERFAHAELAKKVTLSSTHEVVAYYRATLRAAEREELHVLYLDKKNQFIACEKAQEGTVDHTPVYPREVLKRALDRGASAIVLVHNHPSGDPSPSKADIAMTRKIIAGAEPLGLCVHDHLIIGANGFVSLRAQGLL